MVLGTLLLLTLGAQVYFTKEAILAPPVTIPRDEQPIRQTVVGDPLPKVKPGMFTLYAADLIYTDQEVAMSPWAEEYKTLWADDELIPDYMRFAKNSKMMTSSGSQLYRGVKQHFQSAEEALSDLDNTQKRYPRHEVADIPIPKRRYVYEQTEHE